MFCLSCSLITRRNASAFLDENEFFVHSRSRHIALGDHSLPCSGIFPVCRAVPLGSWDLIEPCWSGCGNPVRKKARKLERSSDTPRAQRSPTLRRSNYGHAWRGVNRWQINGQGNLVALWSHPGRKGPLQPTPRPAHQKIPRRTMMSGRSEKAQSSDFERCASPGDNDDDEGH
jgi:hypothetical protein